MERFFVSIRRGDLAEVTRLLDERPELVRATRSKGPKKDLGQQPLGIAIKTRRYAIARLLLERGADVNFIEAEGTADGMRLPVVEDAVESAVATGVGATADAGDHRDAMALLRDMVARGAVVDTINPGHGRPGLEWFAERVVHHGHRGLGPAEVRAVTAIAQVLVDAGADPTRPYTWRAFDSSGAVVQERTTTLRDELAGAGPFFAGPPVPQLLEILDHCVEHRGRGGRKTRWWQRS